MNTKAQLMKISEQFVSSFIGGKLLPLRIFLFIITGLIIVWLYVAIAFVIWLIELFQMPGKELNDFIHDETKSGAVRSLMLFVAYPMVIFRYCVVPLTFIIFFIPNFLYNCFAFVVSLGKAEWHTSIIIKQ